MARLSLPRAAAVVVSFLALLLTAAAPAVDHVGAPTSGADTTTTDPAELAEVPLPDAAPVVVATFDTGTNPFHPCFRRTQDGEEPSHLPASYPVADAVDVHLTFAATYQQSLTGSQDALDGIVADQLHRIVGTNLSFYTADSSGTGLVDVTTHGAEASSQIGCDEFGLGDNAHLVVVNHFDASGDDSSTQTATKIAQFEWVAAQDWIDIVHVNVASLVPVPAGPATEELLRSSDQGLDPVIDSGKLVVVAGGNGIGNSVAFPTEIGNWSGRPGLLVAGANDNGGWTTFSNYSPHVVMDGNRTIAAEGTGFGHRFFSGTSSASPRTTGYVARVLGALRAEFGHTGQGLLTIPAGSEWPATGPLVDGVLLASELDEAGRVTADPNPHASAYDGEFGLQAGVPVPVDTPVAAYAKMGYGEVSEHTIEAAIDVLAGRSPRPDRPMEDTFYELSETQRRAIWE